MARERSEAGEVLTPLQSGVLSSGLTTVTPLALKEKDIETRVLEKYRQRPEDKRRGRLILISLLSVFFAVLLLHGGRKITMSL